ncbi:hypothetical protein [Corynebacterium epidermidicanis]|uniref:DUF4439 family protein n=1 Tax=Corynebacterium epidermidicanis TaxID=1050174 RepID=A0A0G3GQF8_9CORY|nr:hypothetical protein [Corynebacterium epidermidicanis]AKK03379.1 hypothetical protein CEPID_07645 [Corynebacterium epidermidicanis]
MNRCSLILLPVFFLGACSLTPAPTPNPTLNNLGHSALNDAANRTSTSSNIADLRAQQAEQLFAEVRRLCGTTKEGQTPESCLVPTADAQPSTDPANTPQRAAEQILATVGDIPAESMPLIARIHTQLAVLGAHPSITDSAPGNGGEPARKLLEWENSVVYGLHVALAYAGSATPDIESAIERHEARVEALRASIPNAPAAAPAYSLRDYPQPKDAASVKVLLTALESDTVSQWNIAASQSADAAWRAYGLSVSAESARIAAEMLTAQGKDPLQAEFAQ